MGRKLTKPVVYIKPASVQDESAIDWVFDYLFSEIYEEMIRKKLKS